MSLGTTELFSPYASVFGALVIQDTIDTDPNPQVNAIEAMAAGALDRTAQGVANIDPRVSVTCLNLGHLSTVPPSLGLLIESTSKIQYQKRADGGTFSGSGDVTLVASKGMLIPESISAQQDQAEAALLSFLFYPWWNGTDVDADNNPAPLRYVEQALQSSPAIGAMYKLGPCTIAGTSIGGLQSARVQFGLNYKMTRAAGEDAARVGAIYSRRPTFNIEPKNLTVLNTVKLRQVNSVAVVQYFRKLNVSPLGAFHVSLSATGSLMVGNVAAKPDDDPKPGIVFKPDGTITLSTTATLP